MLLEERQAKAELVVVDVMKGEHKEPAHLARQPFGQIPAFEDGDLRLYESRAILRYLDETLPGTPLTPKDPKGRALMEQWISVETSTFGIGLSSSMPRRAPGEASPRSPSASSGRTAGAATRC